jgi:hypothetical protein
MQRELRRLTGSPPFKTAAASLAALARKAGSDCWPRISLCIEGVSEKRTQISDSQTCRPADYVMTLHLAQFGVPSEAWQQAFAVLGAVVAELRPGGA